MKIRKWFFKLLTGYDLVEYQEILHEWQETINEAKTIINLNKEILDNANNECKNLLAMCDEVNRNETLG